MTATWASLKTRVANGGLGCWAAVPFRSESVLRIVEINLLEHLTWSSVRDTKAERE